MKETPFISVSYIIVYYNGNYEGNTFYKCHVHLVYYNGNYEGNTFYKCLLHYSLL